MKPKSCRIARFAAALSLVACSLSAATGATLYWDGNDTNANANGGSGNWLDDAGTTTNWDTLQFGGANSSWTNSNLDTAVFGGTAGTVTIGAGGVTVGGLRFDANNYILDASSNALTFGAANNLIGFSGVSGATITGAVGGTGNVATKMVNPVVGTALTNFSLNLNGTSAGGWSGTTTVGNLSTFALSQSNQALKDTSGITLNGGNITLTNANSTEGALDRISNTAAIASNGGTFTYTNTVGSALVYAETIGKVTASSGQLNFVLTNNLNGGGTPTNSQTLTLGDSAFLGAGIGLAQSGTGNIMFTGNGGLNTTTNIIRVNGITTSMTGNQIIGPWATVGTSAGIASDFAKYTSDGTHGTIVAANIAGSAESTWTNSADAYTLSTAGTTTLTGTRSMMGLRMTSSTGGTIALGNFNLETNAFMNAGAGGVTISSAGTGALTTSTGGGNLYLTSNTNALTISAPIIDNGGAVTVVKYGSNNVTLSSTTSNFSGGVVLNGGTLTVTSNANLGAAGGSITVNSNSTLAFGTVTYARNLIINNGAIATFNGNTTIAGNVTGTGGLAMNNGFGTQAIFTGLANTFEGPILIGSSGTTSQAYRFQFNSLADSATANGRIAFVASSITHADGSVFQYNGLSALTLNNRVIEIASTGATPGNGHQIRASGAANGTLTINTDLLVTSTTAQTLRLGGTNTGNNTFGGKISNGNSSAVSLSKVDAGKWILSGTNSYTGTTTVSAGTLLFNGNSSAVNGAVSVTAGALGGNGSLGGAVTVSGTGGVNLTDGAVGTLTLGSTLGITGAAGANTLSFDLGNNTGTSDQISVAGTTSVTTAGSAVININQLGGVAGRNATTYTLIGGNGTLDAANFAKFSLSTTKAFGQTYALVHDSGTGNGNLQLQATNVTAATPSAFWAGGADNWSTTANWNTDATSGISTGAAPDYQTNVTFSTTTPSPANLATNVLDVDFDINSLTFNAAAGGVTIGGTKTLTIEATNANGNTVGNGIDSQNTSGTNTISAKVGLASSQTWTVANGGTLAVSGAISDFGAGTGFTKAGDGTLTLTGANTYSGGNTITAGILSVNAAAAASVANGPLAISNGGRLAVAATNITSSSQVTIGTGGGAIAVNGNNNFTTTGKLTGSGTLTKPLVTGAGNQTLNFNSVENDFTGSIVIDNSNGSGITNTVGFNSLVDTASPGAGNLVVGGAATSSTAYFALNAGAIAPLTLTNRQIELANVSTTGGGGVNNLNTGHGVTINSNLLVSGPAGARNLKLSSVAGPANIFAGNISDGTGSPVGLIKEGTGTWSLTNASNAFTGPILLNSTTTSAGTLAYASAGGANPITFNQTTSTGTATLSYIGSTIMTMSGAITANALTAGTITLDSSGSGSVNYSNPASLGSAASGIKNLTLSGTSTGSNTLNGIWADNTGAAATLTKNGNGKWILANANTFTGIVTVSAGTLVMANTQALGLGTGNNNIGGGTLDIATNGSDTVYNFTSGSGAVANIISNVATGSVGINHTLGNYAIGGSTSAGVSQLNVTAGAGIISGAPSITITALSMTSGTASPVISTLNPTSANLIIGTVTSSNGSATNSRTLNLDGTSIGNQITGAISDGTSATVTAVTKSNSGLWTLSGTNTYSGLTSVTAGTLLVNNPTGSGTGTGAVSVAAGAFLGGTGTIAPTGANGINVTGVLLPGGSVIGNMTLDLASTTGTVAMITGSGFNFNLGAANALISSITLNSSDLLTLAGASASDFAFNSNAIDFLGTGEAGFYKLFNTSIDDASTWTGLTFDGTTGEISSGLTLTNLAGGLTGSLLVGTASNGGTTGDIYLQVAAIPEPSTALLGALGLLALLRRKR